VAAEANNGICSAGVAYEAKIGGNNKAIFCFYRCIEHAGMFIASCGICDFYSAFQFLATLCPASAAQWILCGTSFCFFLSLRIMVYQCLNCTERSAGIPLQPRGAADAEARYQRHGVSASRGDGEGCPLPSRLEWFGEAL